MNANVFDILINFLKINGYIYNGSVLYGGLKNTFDYGPNGVILKKIIKNLWKKIFISSEWLKTFEIEPSQLLNKNVWIASQHVDNFLDFFYVCEICKKMFLESDIHLINNKDFFCTYCQKKQLYIKKKHSLMFRIDYGSNKKHYTYLRPELAQGIILNFNNIVNSFNPSLPFGIYSNGKSFRKEKTPRKYIFKTYEFEQVEIEIFINNENSENIEDIWNKVHTLTKDFVFKKLLIKKENINFEEIKLHDLAFYSKRTTDINYKYCFGWGELAGIADRGTYDIKNHNKYSNQRIIYRDKKTSIRIIEPSFGIDRLLLAVLCEFFTIETENKKRTFLKLPFELCPIQIAVIYIVPKYKQYAQEIYIKLKSLFRTKFEDNTRSIGKKYFKNDQMGVYFCITIDKQYLENEMIGIRYRDNCEQVFIKISDLIEYIRSNK